MKTSDRNLKSVEMLFYMSCFKPCPFEDIVPLGAELLQEYRLLFPPWLFTRESRRLWKKNILCKILEITPHACKKAKRLDALTG